MGRDARYPLGTGSGKAARGFPVSRQHREGGLDSNAKPDRVLSQESRGYRAAFAGNVSLAPFSYNYSTVIAPLNDVQGEMGERHAAAGHDGLTPLGPGLECSLKPWSVPYCSCSVAGRTINL